MKAFHRISLRIIYLLALLSSPVMAQDMTPERMEAIIQETGSNVETAPNVIQFSFEEVLMICIYDATYDRMRLVAPIIEMAELTDEQRDKMLEANYHAALDARYAISEGVVFSVFIHPLAALTDTEFESAIQQVAVLGLTFGTSYTSGVLSFGEDQ